MHVWGTLRKGVGVLVVAVVLLGTACGGGPLPIGGGSPSAKPSATLDPVAAAWRKCGATQVPPKEVREGQLPASTLSDHTLDISENDALRIRTAFGRTNTYVNWSIENNQLGVLTGPCVAAPMGHAEDDDIKIVEAAQRSGGHAVFEPPAVPVRIGIRSVPSKLADSVERRTSKRPSTALILISKGATIWINDSNGKHLRKFIESDVNAFYASVVVGTVRDDGIGLRLWQQLFLPCTDPEVAGVCDGYV
jgi:hypothetical protein